MVKLSSMMSYLALLIVHHAKAQNHRTSMIIMVQLVTLLQKYVSSLAYITR